MRKTPFGVGRSPLSGVLRYIDCRRFLQNLTFSQDEKQGTRMNRLYKTRIVLQVVAAIGVGLVSWTVSAQTAAPAAPATPDVARGQAIATQVCAACHGADGNSAGGAFPKLAGQHAGYIVKELKDYKTQPGAKEPARKNPIMAGIAGALNDQDMINVAAYFESQKRKPGYARDKATVPLGQKIYRGGIADKGVPACAACHGPGLRGTADIPNIAGQHSIVIARQLFAFKAGDRAGAMAGLMQPVVEKLTDDDIVAIAAFVASLDPL